MTGQEITALRESMLNILAQIAKDPSHDTPSRVQAAAIVLSITDPVRIS